jgi:hypothetical protein
MKFILLIFALMSAPLRAQVTDAGALAFLQKHAPEIHRQVAPLEKSDPQDFRSAIDDAKQAATEHAKFVAAGDTAAAAASLKMYALDFAAIGLADDIVQSKDDEETKQLTAKLREVISASCEQWAIVEQARIRRMEGELAKLKTELQAALADKNGVVEKDTAALIEECREYQRKKKAAEVK